MEIYEVFSPFPNSDIAILNEELNQCLGNHNGLDNFNLSMISSVQNESIKLKKMQNKMSLYQLRCLVLQLFDIIRTQNKMIKKQILSYENQIILLSQKFIQIIKKNTKTNQLKFQSNMLYSNNYLKQRNQRIITLESQQDVLLQNYYKLQNQIQKLKSEFQTKAQTIKSLKKENYVIHEDNFYLKQKVEELTLKLSEQKEEYEKQKDHLLKSIESLQLIIRSKQNSIESLENNMKRKGSDSKYQLNVGKVISTSDLLSVYNGKVLDTQFVDKTHGKQLQKIQYKHQFNNFQPNKTVFKQVRFETSRNSHSRTRSNVPIKNYLSSQRKPRSISKQRMSFQKMQMQLANLKAQISNDLKIVGKR